MHISRIFLIYLFFLKSILTNTNLTIKMYEPMNYVFNYATKYLRLKSIYDSQNKKHPFVISLETGQNNSLLTLIYEIYDETFTHIDKNIIKFFTFDKEENELARYSRCFFIVTNELLIKFSLQINFLINKIFSKRTDLLVKLDQIFYTEKDHYRFLQKFYFFEPIIKYFYVDYLEKDIKFYYDPNKDKFLICENEIDLVSLFVEYYTYLSKTYYKSFVFDHKKYFYPDKKISCDQSENESKLIKFYICSIFESKEYTFLANFIPEINLLKEVKELQISTKKNLRFVHGVSNHLLFQFNLVYFMIFGKSNFLYTKKFIPKYKLNILLRLKFKLRFFLCYFFEINSDKSTKHIEDYLKIICLISFSKLSKNYEKCFYFDDLVFDYEKCKEMVKKNKKYVQLIYDEMQRVNRRNLLY
ncbi:hypothetical protein TUBRATIS_006820 [Tubulinosema ratisbonensis]|uniref:Uncharacterized protein n=1 Tax=Tubulinosema ratisbonensis TaxID=291195 RepID=A0A437AP01_9MICR|nr:hypothetical protein TUBRATIS_006820 [Tubulinosema ratisbonensis]